MGSSSRNCYKILFIKKGKGKTFAFIINIKKSILTITHQDVLHL